MAAITSVMLTAAATPTTAPLAMVILWRPSGDIILPRENSLGVSIKGKVI